MPATTRLPEQLGLQVYIGLEKYKCCRQIQKKSVLAKEKTPSVGCWFFVLFFFFKMQFISKSITLLLQIMFQLGNFDKYTVYTVNIVTPLTQNSKSCQFSSAALQLLLKSILRVMQLEVAMTRSDPH